MARFDRVCVCDDDSIDKIDPTGTGAIRRKYRSIANAKWRTLTNALRVLVIDQDFFGLSTARGRDLTLRILVPKEGRVAAFEGWLDSSLSTLTEPETFSFGQMVKETYAQATFRAVRLSGKAIYSMGYQASNIRDLAAIELRGIVEALKQNLIRQVAFSNGETPAQLYFAMSEAVRKIATNRTNTLINVLVVKAHAHGTLDQFELAGVEHVGILPEYIVNDGAVVIADAKKKRKARSKAKASSKSKRTSTITRPKTGPGSRLKPGQIPSRSTLYRMRKAQKRLEALERVEVVTAGDDDVCVVCEDIAEGSPYTINVARSLIPAHPNCRCAFVPVAVIIGDTNENSTSRPWAYRDARVFACVGL